ncbi:MAG: Lrp/AsnC family transcriptional regulator [Kiloniellales bacterium]
MSLDRIDRRILDLLQSDNQLSNLALADKVGLSPPACSRRVARLRREGVIAKDASLLDPQKVGKSLTAIVTVVLETRRRERLEAFSQRMRALEPVKQCYMIAGSVDFFLVVLLDDMAAYSAFASESLASDPDIKGYETWFVLAEVKNDSSIRLEG